MITFRPSTTTIITIAKHAYRFSEHPSAKGMPYGQTGRRATVYQVIDPNGQPHALKIFTKAFRSPRYESMAKSLAAFASLPGLQVCARTVLTSSNQNALIEKHPDLEHAILMPWVSGQTWQEIVLSHQPLSAEQSHNLALGLLEILSAMESREMAHCDLSGPNMIIKNRSPKPSIALVDVEELHASNLERPKRLPAGSAGYGHKAAANGLWQANADRFAGAVLLAEIVGWRDESVRRIAYGEQFFDPAEVQLTGDRLKVLKDALKRAYGPAVVEVFVQAWFSERLDACPTFGDWVSALGNNNGATNAYPIRPQPASISTDNPQLDDAGHYLLASFKAKLDDKNFEEAEKLLNALHALAPDFAEPTRLLYSARQEQAEVQAAQEKLAEMQHEYEEKSAVLQNQRKALSNERTELEAHLHDLEQREAVLKENEQELKILKDRIHVQKQTSSASLDLAYRENLPFKARMQLKKAKLVEMSILKHKKFLGPTLSVVETFFIDNNEVFTLTDDGAAHIWSLLADEEEKWIVANATPTAASFSKDKNWLAVGDIEGEIRLLDRQKDETIFIIIDEYVNALTFLPGDNQLAVGSPTGYSIFSYDGNLVRSNSQRCIYSFSSSLDGRYFAWASDDGFLQILYQGLKIGDLQVGDEPEFVFDPTNQFLYVSNSTGMIKKIAVNNLEVVLSFSTVESKIVTAVSISPDGQLLATSTDDGFIYLWRTGDGKLLETKDAHKYGINSLDFHPNGQYLVSGSDDGNAIIWVVE